MNDYLNHIAQRNLSQRRFFGLLNEKKFGIWLKTRNPVYIRSSIHFGNDFRVNNRSREFGNFPYGYYNAQWILIPDVYSSTLKWYHRDGFKNIIPDFVVRATAHDYWVNRRRYLKYWFSEYEIFKLLKTDFVLQFLINLDFSIVSFFSKYFFFDFLLIALKYWLLDFLFLNSFFWSPIESLVPELFVDFCSTYRFFCIKLLLAVSDRWLWLIMGMFKMFFSTIYYFVYDDIFGFFMLYRGSSTMLHSFIPLDPMGYRVSTYYPKQKYYVPTNIINLLPLKFTRRKAHWLAYLGYRRGLEKWDYYHRQGSFISRFYFSNLNPDKLEFYSHYFKPKSDLQFLAYNFPQRYKSPPTLYVGRVYRLPFEQSRMKSLEKFKLVVSYQTLFIRPYLHVLQEYDFSVRRSLKRLKLNKYYKPRYSLKQPHNYFFSLQNELLRNLFQIPSHSNKSLSNSINYKLGYGFNKPVFAQIAPTDLLINHFFVSSSNYHGMPKIEFNRDFNVLKLNGNYMHKIRVPLNYSIYRPYQYRYDSHFSVFLDNSKMWVKGFKDDPFRKSLFYFFQWDWAGGFFREFFVSPLHSGFSFFSGGLPQRYRTPVDEYAVPFWLNFFRISNNSRYVALNKSLDFYSANIQSYDRSLIFDRFSYNPNFRRLNPYELISTSQFRPFSSFYDFVDKPGVRQRPHFSNFKVMSHVNFFPMHSTKRSHLHVRGSDIKRPYLQETRLFSDFLSNSEEEEKPVRDLQGEVLKQYLPSYMKDTLLGPKPQNVSFGPRRRVYYLHISFFWRIFFQLYISVFEVIYVYCLFVYFCYKQIFFVLFCVFLLRLYFYSIQISFFEYRKFLLDYKNYLIFNKLLYFKYENYKIPETSLEKFISMYLPHNYRQPCYILSENYIGFRRNLVRRFFFESFSIFFIKPVIFVLFVLYYYLSNIKISQFFLVKFFIKQIHLIFLFYKFFLIYFFSKFFLKFLMPFYKFFIFIFKLIKIFFSPSTVNSLFSNIFNVKFFLFNVIYFFKVFFFFFNFLLFKLFKIIRFLFIVSFLVFLIDFYVLLSGNFLSTFSPSFLSYFLVFFVLWIFSNISKTFSNNFFGSEFPEYQPFLEDSGLVNDIYSINEPDLFLPDSEDLDFDEFSFSSLNLSEQPLSPSIHDDSLKNPLKNDSRFLNYKKILNIFVRSEQFSDSKIPDSYRIIGLDDDLDELMDYEGVSLDFSDGEYFNVENKELIVWLKTNFSFLSYLSSFYGKNKNSNEIFDLVPQDSYRYAVNAQRFVIYTEALSTLNILTKQNFFMNVEQRFFHELSEIYASFVFPYHKYYRRMFNVNFAENFFSDNIEQDLILPMDSRFSIYSFDYSFDSSSLFSEYDLDEIEEDLFDIDEESGFDDSGQDPDIYPFDLLEEEEDDDSLFGLSENLEEDWDDLEEEGVDFFIPSETYYSEKFLFQNFSSFDFFSCGKFSPLELSSFYNSEMFDDFLLFKKSSWISEVLVDRFLINISEQQDVSLANDFSIFTKVSLYTDDAYDENFFSIKSGQQREFYLKFFQLLKQSEIGLITFGLKKALGISLNDSTFFNNISKYYKGDLFYDNDFSNPVDLIKDSSVFKNFDFNSLFINSVNNGRVFFVIHHPYGVDLSKRLNLKIYPILGHEVFDNKYKRRFFKNPFFYIKLLNLKNYPELTEIEFKRLCIYFGCIKSDWDSVDNYSQFFNKPYNSIDYPVLLVLLMFFSQGKDWFRYEIMEPRYYQHSEISVFRQLTGSWWFTLDDFVIAPAQAFNDLSEYTMPFITFYLSCKNFFTFIFELLTYFCYFLIQYFRGDLNFFNLFNFHNSGFFSNSSEIFFLFKYLYIIFTYFFLIWHYKYIFFFNGLWDSLNIFFSFFNSFYIFVSKYLVQFFYFFYGDFLFRSFFDFSFLFFVIDNFINFLLSINLKSIFVYFFSSYFYYTDFFYESFVFLYFFFPFYLFIFFFFFKFI